ncbi:MAG: hypothetical protein HZA68_13130 [Rhodovulum sp.]|nr:hypothetical protein [Rhodovulum sp.]
MTHSPETCLHCAILEYVGTRCLCDEDDETIDNRKLLSAIHQIGSAVATLVNKVFTSTDDERHVTALMHAYVQGFNSVGGDLRMSAPKQRRDTSTAAENTH